MSFIETSETRVCKDYIDPIAFIISSIASFTCAVVGVLASCTVSLIGKKLLIIITFLLIGTFCALANFITQEIVFAVLLSSIPVLTLAVGPVHAYAVEIYPTHLRGMAVCLCMMLGRVGSVIGTNVAGVLLNTACEFTFYGFGGLLIVCGLLAVLLPRTHKKPTGRLQTSIELMDL